MDRYIAPEDMTLDQLREELTKSYSRWEEIRTKGGSDPFYPDGFSMNLVRNHIIWWKSHIKAKLQTEQLSMFDSSELEERPTPPIVPDNYVTPGTKYSNRFDNDPYWKAIVHEI